MNLVQLMRDRAQRAWRVIVASPVPPTSRLQRPPRVGWVPLSKTPLRRKRSTDAGPWSDTPPTRWKR